MIQKEELDDFDELFDEGFVDVCDMDEVLEGSKELEYVLSKEAIEYLKSKLIQKKRNLRILFYFGAILSSSMLD